MSPSSVTGETVGPSSCFFLPVSFTDHNLCRHNWKALPPCRGPSRPPGTPKARREERADKRSFSAPVHRGDAAAKSDSRCHYLVAGFRTDADSSLWKVTAAGGRLFGDGSVGSQRVTWLLVLRSGSSMIDVLKEKRSLKKWDFGAEAIRVLDLLSLNAARWSAAGFESLNFPLSLGFSTSCLN